MRTLSSLNLVNRLSSEIHLCAERPALRGAKISRVAWVEALEMWLVRMLLTEHDPLGHFGEQAGY